MHTGSHIRIIPKIHHKHLEQISLKLNLKDRLKLINKINMDLPVGQHTDGEEGTKKQSPSQSLKFSQCNQDQIWQTSTNSPYSMH